MIPCMAINPDISGGAVAAIDNASASSSSGSFAAALSRSAREELLINVNVSMVRALIEEITALRYRMADVVETRATGSGNVALNASMTGSQFRLIYVRGHFTGGSGTATMAVTHNHSTGAAYDTLLYTTKAVGTGSDLNLRFTEDESAGPSPWTFQDGDSLDFAWTDPGTTTYGISVGLARV